MEKDQAIYDMLVAARSQLRGIYWDHLREARQLPIGSELRKVMFQKIITEARSNIGEMTKLIEAHPLHQK